MATLLRPRPSATLRLEANMNVELNPDEAELVRMMLLAEVEAKRVEVHHARNIDYKSELQKQERALRDILRRMRE